MIKIPINGFLNKAFLPTVIGVFVLPVIGFSEHYISSDIMLTPRWDFYPGVLLLSLLALVISYLYMPKSRWKSFLAGFTCLYLLHSFLSDAHPNLKRYDNILVQQISSIAKIILPNASANTVINGLDTNDTGSEIIFTLNLKNILSESHLSTVLASSNLKTVLIHDTLSRKKEISAVPEYEWSEYSETEKTIPIRYAASPDYIALEVRADGSLFIPLRGKYGTPTVPIETRTWGDFYWAFGFLRQQSHVSVNIAEATRMPRDNNITKQDYGIFLSRWDVPIESKRFLDEANIRTVVVRAGSAHNLDRMFDSHIEKLSNTDLKNVFPLYNFDPGYDLDTQLDLLKIQIKKGKEINLSTEKIVVSFINSKISKLHKSDDPLIAELARQAAGRHVKKSEAFITQIQEEFPNSELILYLGPHDYLNKLSIVENSPLKTSSIWFAGMSAQNDQNYISLKNEFRDKFKRSPVWMDQEMYIPVALAGSRKELNAKYQRFSIEN